MRERHATSPAVGTLLYLHGLGESGLGFEGLMASPALASWRQVAPDLPGYGKSPWLEEPPALDEHAARLAAWTDDRLPGPLVVVGHSMGGVLGTLLCERLAPGRAGGFLNVEGNVSLADCGFSSQVAAHSVEAILAGEFDRILDRLYRDGVNDRALRTYYPSMRMCDPRAYHRNGVELVELSRAGEMAARMAALGVPALYLLGRPRGTGERSRTLLERAGVAWRAVDDAGHWPFLDQPPAFLKKMLAFLDGLAAGA